MNSNWIAVDWGTSNLRAWVVDEAGNVFSSAKSDRGSARLQPSEFEPALLDLTNAWLDQSRVTEVIVSGMAGAKAGWKEAPYLEAPCKPFSPISTVSPRIQDPRMSVTILPGIKTDKPGIDIIRGEETQIAGYIGERAGFDGVICLPGTHSKWVRVENGLIVSFQTFMSGELYDLLANQSTLSSCVSDGGSETEEFISAVESGIRQPSALSGQLFGIRAASLLTGLSPARAAARLSGLIIGAELASCKPFWLGRNIVIIGDSPVSEAYALSLSMQGQKAEIFAAAEAAVAGLREFRRMRKRQA